MSTREERLARNEAIARHINEAIQRSHNDSRRQGLVRMVCECGIEDCERLIAMSVGEYEDVRRNPRCFACLPDHVSPDVEEVVGEKDRYVIVEKRGPIGPGIAERHNPRA